MSKAWLDAASDLGIRVIAPYSMTMPDGSIAIAEAFVPDFGSPGGAIAISVGNPLGNDAKRIGKWCSILYESYRVYDRELFIGTLDDWRWFGEGNAPDWYSGKPWC
jgi:hypothetical protein